MLRNAGILKSGLHPARPPVRNNPELSVDTDRWAKCSVKKVRTSTPNTLSDAARLGLRDQFNRLGFDLAAEQVTLATVRLPILA